MKEEEEEVVWLLIYGRWLCHIQLFGQMVVSPYHLRQEVVVVVVDLEVQAESVERKQMNGEQYPAAGGPLLREDKRDDGGLGRVARPSNHILHLSSGSEPSGPRSLASAASLA